MTRVINFNTQQEGNRYLKKKTFENASRFQSKTIPIPRYDPIANDEVVAYYL
jgi:WASH complex subunit strumpellin